eukprot:TRINITY_DN18982_c0_g1_i2.p1 TRINITY_DN18982_c0_g1~~TRINITY_DN18982_c0_g1_i2.p1  ORF type:complete len:328 (-),score=70.56 TRINITY_DN18982_c0_g1_i2:129-1112(-)
MAIMKRVVKPKNKRSKRALEAREPKAIENQKTTVLVRGTNCSQLVQDCLKDLHTLKKPEAVNYSQKNDIRPFEDATKLEFYSKKLDASLFAFGNHNKKRPNNLILGRMFDNHLLDMIELGVDSFTALKEFKNSKVTAGSKPCLLFAGEPFADTTNLEMQRLKSLLIDFFRGPEVTNLRLAGIEHALQFTAVEKKVFLRSYKISMKKSGGRIPRIELEEIGPSLDLSLRRTHLASDDLFKSACKQVKNVRSVKKVKNISEDAFGTKLGRVHIQPQEIEKIQTRKTKALKETKEEKLEVIQQKKEKAESARKRAVAAVFADDDEVSADE